MKITCKPLNTIRHVLLALVLLSACKDKYEPNLNNPDTGYLVLEGFINSGMGNTDIKLSRTVRLADSARIDFENNAVVTVEGDNNTSYPLYSSGPGLYRATDLQLDAANLYRIHIFTQDGREYLSDYSKVVRTPAFDSIPYRREEDGVHIDLETHDPSNSTRYYTWEYSETWEILSRYIPSLKFTYDERRNITGVEYINPFGTPDYTRQRCWRTEGSTKIRSASTIKLASDQLIKELVFIENESWKLDVLYSVNVKMHGCTAPGFDFLQRMARNNEQVGSIFDAQPSELNSNLHSVTDPSEPVIGFVEVADLREQRIFISKADVGGWDYRQTCEEATVANVADDLKNFTSYAPLFYADPFGGTVKMASEICVYCTLRGGNIKPDFWP